MNIAIVGCGNIADTHAGALAQLGQKLVAAVDRNEERAAAFALKWHADRFSTQFADALTEEVDCVHVCTPPALHYEMLKQILLAGKHVICEKPLCLKKEQARELWELAEKNKLVAAVNFNVRYHEACGRAKALITAADFGNIHLISGSYKQEFHVLPTQYMWRYMPELAGPMRAVTEIGSHWIDLVRFWTGLEITKVSATFGCFHPERTIKDGMMYPRQAGDEMEKVVVASEDAACVTFRFSGGALGTLLLSEVSHGRSNQVRLEVSSARQSVWWDSESPYQLHQARKSSGVITNVNAFGGGFPDTFAGFFQDIYQTLNSRNQQSAEYKCMYPSFFDGYQNIAVCEAIYQSAVNDSCWVEV